MNSARKAAMTCALGTLTINLNITALSLAVPSIRQDLGLSTTAMAWVASSYALILAALVMLGGSLGDRFNKKTVLTAGLIIYTLGSAWGAVSPNGVVLTLSRIAAAVGAAVLVPVGLAAMRQIAKSPAELATYMATWAVAVGAGQALGPALGGILTALAGWRALFWAMTGLGLVFLVLLTRYLPQLPTTQSRPIGLGSQALVALWMITLTGFLIEVNSGASVWLKLALLVSFVGGLALWLWWDRRTAKPVIPAQVRRSAAFWLPLAVSVPNMAALGMSLFVGSLYLQDHLAVSPALTGLLFVPMALTTGLAGSWSGRSLLHWGPRRVTLAAAGATVLGVILAGAAGGQPRLAALIGITVGAAVIGLGFGSANTPINYLVVSAVPPAAAGVGGSAASASRQLGQAIGISLGALLISLGQASHHSNLAYLWPVAAVIACGGLMAALASTYPGQPTLPEVATSDE